MENGHNTNAKFLGQWFPQSAKKNKIQSLCQSEKQILWNTTTASACSKRFQSNVLYSCVIGV
jgi:hypothetical protein